MSKSAARSPVGRPASRLRATVSALRKTSGITTALPQLSTAPPPSSEGSEPASRRKSRRLVAPIAAPSAEGCWCTISAPRAACTVTGTPCRWQPSRMETAPPASPWRAGRAARGGRLVPDLRAGGRVHSDRHAVPVAAEQNGHRAARESLARGERRRETLPVAEAPLGRIPDGGIHLPSGLLHHAEGAVAPPRLAALAGGAEGGELEVVDRGRAVHGDVAHDPPLQPAEHQGPEPHLDHVPAEHHDHAPA